MTSTEGNQGFGLELVIAMKEKAAMTTCTLILPKKQIYFCQALHQLCSFACVMKGIAFVKGLYVELEFWSTLSNP